MNSPSPSITARDIERVLPCELVRWQAHYKPVLTSTQDHAAELFAKSGRGGLLVLAERQEKGRGREGRSWEAPEGTSLLFSLVLLPGHVMENIHILTIVGALAVCDALRNHLGLSPQVKWPNDVLLQGRKVCGILTELRRTPKHGPAIILGMGLNVNQEAGDFPPSLRDIATSLRMEKGSEIDRLSLLGAVMKAFEQRYFLFQKGDRAELIRCWKNYSSMAGRRVTLHTGEKVVAGTVLDLADSGALVLRLDTGVVQAFFGSECRFA